MSNVLQRLIAIAVMVLTSHSGSLAQPLRSGLADLAFLQGRWKVLTGKNAVSSLYGAREVGVSDISSTANGRALIKQDHFELIGVEGQSLGSASPAMLIYTEASTLRAELVSGNGVIHYTAIHVERGKSATFEGTSANGSSRLTYLLTAPDKLSVTVEAGTSEKKEFRVTATQTLQKDVAATP